MVELGWDFRDSWLICQADYRRVVFSFSSDHDHDPKPHERFENNKE